jgi:dipeptidyl aminopeptidase/acylaminoacyl peptidase
VIATPFLQSSLMFDELMIPVDSDGEAVRLHAWLANPDRPGKHPAISMAHGSPASRTADCGPLPSVSQRQGSL